jgi:hypothetical protein
MAIPGFTAEAALSQRQGHYRMIGGSGFLAAGRVLPQRSPISTSASANRRRWVGLMRRAMSGTV